MNYTQLSKILFPAIGGIIAYLQPSIKFIIICMLAVALDVYTAWQLSIRVKKNHPGKNDGKFKSKHAVKFIDTLLKMFAIIVISYLIDKEIFPDIELHLANIASGMFCFVQIWSVLENESSLNNKRWARVLQKVMVSKVERHLNIDISEELKNKEDEIF